MAPIQSKNNPKSHNTAYQRPPTSARTGERERDLERQSLREKKMVFRDFLQSLLKRKEKKILFRQLCVYVEPLQPTYPKSKTITCPRASAASLDARGCVSFLNSVCPRKPAYIISCFKFGGMITCGRSHGSKSSEFLTLQAKVWISSFREIK